MCGRLLSCATSPHAHACANLCVKLCDFMAERFSSSTAPVGTRPYEPRLESFLTSAGNNFVPYGCGRCGAFLLHPGTWRRPASCMPTCRRSQSCSRTVEESLQAWQHVVCRPLQTCMLPMREIGHRHAMPNHIERAPVQTPRSHSVSRRLALEYTWVAWFCTRLPFGII